MLTERTPTIKEVRRALVWAKETGDKKKAALLQAYLKQQRERPITRHCRATGTRVTVCTAEDAGAGLDGKQEGLRWFTVCDTHGTCVGHASKRVALQWAANPSWCEDCQKILCGELPKHETKRAP